MVVLDRCIVESVPLMKAGLSMQDQGGWSDGELDGVEGILEQMKLHPPHVSRQQCIRTTMFFSVLCFVLGTVTSYVLFTLTWNSSESTIAEPVWVSKKIIDGIQEHFLREFLRNLTKKPHVAGMAGDLETAKYVQNVWETQGLDKVYLVPYEVLLSYPSNSQPNRITVIKNSDVVMSGLGNETPLRSDGDFNVIPPFAAYSAQKVVTGDLIYVNYGRREDFAALRKLNIPVSGNIAVARLGKVFRGNIAALAEQFEAAGLIVYPDPVNYAPNGRDDVYPKSVYLPPSGVQRGTFLTTDGDPLTPFYPSTVGIYRIPEKNATLPHIPIHVISYDDAHKLLRDMSGPTGHEVGLDFSYRLGPGYTDKDKKVKMEIYNNRTVATTYNVIGIIHGKVEPDRYIIVGNHRDAWTFGAADPNSGTAAMLEISRNFGKLLTKGWRPRRSIIFCSWGAEEYALIGSYEWVEEFQKQLAAGAVAYLNVDIAVAGNFTLNVKATPLLYQVFWDSAKRIPSPEERDSLYDTWLQRFPWNGSFSGHPKILSLDSGSDYEPFIHGLGISSAHLFYTCKTGEVACYPLYHSAYETFYYMDQLLDRGFQYHKALTRLWAEVTQSLADSPLLPFSISHYAAAVNDSFIQFRSKYNNFIGKNLTLKYFEEAVEEFAAAAKTFDKDLKHIDKKNPLVLRQTNDQLMQVERAFISFVGMPWRRDHRHVLFAPSKYDDYAGTDFAGVVDTFAEMQLHSTSEIPKYLWEQAQQQLTAIVFHLRAASTGLRKQFCHSL